MESEEAIYHFVGIGGIGMSALARILLDQKMRVTGSDAKESALVAALKAQGAHVAIGHRSANLPQKPHVIYSSAVPGDNEELSAARAQGAPVMHRSQLLAQLMEGYKGLLVAGTHGKTSCTALLAWVLLEADLDPCFAVGGCLRDSNSNGRHGSGPYFVAEADESDCSHETLPAFGAIVTGAEPEHLDHFGTPKAFHDSFRRFLSEVESSEHLFWCFDDLHLRQLSPPGISYGRDQGAFLRLTHFRQNGFSLEFSCTFRSKRYERICLPLVGRHQALNALAVFGMALSLGVPEERIRAAFQSFPGIARRLELKGSVRGAKVFDDYAHHPTELRATLEGLRLAARSRRIIAAIQPHRFTRTRDCLDLYEGVCAPADEVIVTDIYCAREEPIEGLDRHAVLERLSHPCARAIPRSQLVETLAPMVRPLDIVVFFGAGDVSSASGELLSLLERHPPEKYGVALLAGGHHTEYDVSMTSAHFVGEWLRDDTYDVQKLTLSAEQPLSGESFAKVADAEVIFPMFHGPKGEDGLYAALAELVDRPCVGCSARSSALCMDKALAKRVLMSHGLPTLPFVELCRGDPFSVDGILEKLALPLIVKPATLGSSVGVRRTEDVEELRTAIQYAFQFDRHILIERALSGREMEFAVLEGEVARPGEILTEGKLYSKEGKYGPAAMATDVSPRLASSVMQKGQELALAAFCALRCEGMARVDFFLCHGSEWWISEVNPIPGCTPTSLYPKLWGEMGVAPEELVDRLICHAMRRWRHAKQWERVAEEALAKSP